MVDLEHAVDELYSADPDEFMDRRAALVADVRKDDRELAKQIGALRKPTRSAWTLNRLARAHPELIEQVAGLAGELRAAERSLDGDKLRELTARRREVVNTVAATAFTETGQREPSAALRDEVAGTVEAALADTTVAEALGSGTLVRAAQWSGFGVSAPPDLAIVPTPRRPRAAAEKKAPEAAQQSAAERAEEQRRQQAQESLEQARQAMKQAQRSYADQEQVVRRLTDQLAEARRQLADRGVELRQAQRDERAARKSAGESGR